MDECVGDKRSFSFAESCLYFDIFEEDSDRPKKRKNLGLESRFGGKRFGLTKAQMKGCRSLRELSLKMMNEGQLISMKPPQRMQKKTNKKFRLDSEMVPPSGQPKDVSSESDCSN